MYEGLSNRKVMNGRIMLGKNLLRNIKANKDIKTKSKRNWKQRLLDYGRYCLMTTSMHGFVHLIRPGRHKYERLFWIAIIILAAIPCFLIGRNAVYHYLHNPTVISIERDRWHWELDFPAVTICMNSLDEIELQKVADERGMNISHAKEFFNVLFLGNFSNYGQLERFGKDFDWLDPEEYLKYNKRFSYVVGDETTATMNDVSINYTEIVTEFGICYQYYSRISNFISFEYVRNKTRKWVEMTPAYRTTTNTEDESLYFGGLAGNLSVFVHSSTEIIDIKARFRKIVEAGTYETLEVTVMSTVTPEDVRKLSVEQRNCRFLDESNLQYFAIYTQSACIVECRMKLALRLCGCLPYFYNNIYNEKTCDIQGMICLNNFQYYLIQLEDVDGNSLCKDCMTNCNEDRFTEVGGSVMPWVTESSVYHVTLKHLSQIRYKRSLIFTETDLLVQIGGLVGLCFGLSILSLVEVLYFLTLRFYFSVIRPRLP